MQRVIIALGDPVVSESIQEILSDLCDPGILKGYELTAATANTVTVNPGVAMTDSGVLIIEDEQRNMPFTLTVSPQNFTVFYQYIPTKNFGGNPATLTLQPGLIPAEGFVNGVVIGWIKYPGSSVALDPDTMFIQANSFRLEKPIDKLSDEYTMVYGPFDSKWTQLSTSGPVSTVSSAYDVTYKGPVTKIENATLLPLAQSSWLIPFRVPHYGVGKVGIELQVDSGAIATITVLDKLGNEIVPAAQNFFTNSPMAFQVLPIPANVGLETNDEMFVKLAFSIQPSFAIRIKAVGISSYTDPF